MLQRIWTAFCFLLPCAICGGPVPAVQADRPAAPIAIVVAADASAPERQAALQLQHFLREIYAADFSILSAPGEEQDHIFVGHSPWTREMDTQPLGTDGICILTRGRDLILTGGQSRGTLNAVFTFLQDALDCRWYAPDQQRIPRRTLPANGLEHGLRSLTGELAIRYVPPFIHRQYFGAQTQDPAFAVRNRLNGRNWQPALPEEWGGGVRMAYPTGGHTLIRRFLKPEDHFEHRPEWFAWRRSAGAYQPVQPCMTHPQVHQQISHEVLAYLQEHYASWGPGPKIVSVSNADNDTYCQCDRCEAAYEREGGKSGPLLELVNAVAEQVAPRYPDVLVSTLAYWITAAPPRTVRARENVLIQLGTMQRDHKLPVQKTQYGGYLKHWARIARHVYVWDYDTNYHNYMRPHPSYFSVPQSLRFFLDEGVSGVFVQGGWGRPELHPMRAWVSAQLLWDPRGNTQDLIREFAEAYYGSAAQQVLAYMRIMEKAVHQAEGNHLSVYGTTEGWLTLPVMNAAQQQLTQALEGIGEDPRLLPRIQALQMCLDVIWLERYQELRRAAQQEDLPFLGPEDPLELLEHYASNPLKVSTMREGSRGDYGQFFARIRAALTND